MPIMGDIYYFMGGLIIILPLYQYIPLAVPSSPGVQAASHFQILRRTKNGTISTKRKNLGHLRTLNDNLFQKHLDMKNTV